MGNVHRHADNLAQRCAIYSDFTTASLYFSFLSFHGLGTSEKPFSSLFFKMETVEDMMANVDLRAEPGLSLTLAPTMSGSQVAMSSASLPPSGMTEATSNASSQITGQAYVSGASVDVLYVEKIQNLQPCCLAFFPTFRHHFVVGTYSLEDATTQSRTGSLLLYLIQDDKL